MAVFQDTLALFHENGVIYGCCSFPIGKKGQDFAMEEAAGQEYCLKCIARSYLCYQRIRMAFFGWTVNWERRE